MNIFFCTYGSCLQISSINGTGFNRVKKHFFKKTLYIVHEKLLLYREGAKNAGKRHKKLPKPTLKVQGKVRPNGKRNFLVAGVIKIFLPGMMCICTCMHKISFPNLSKGFF